MRPLTTTSYAMLGLLALRPWTNYELAKQMEASLRNFRPRAERRIYDEPKKLVGHGLATVTREAAGKRPLSVYEITPTGRQALQVWLDEPSALAALEFEALVKVFFADGGRRVIGWRRFSRSETDTTAAPTSTPDGPITTCAPADSSPAGTAWSASSAPCRPR